MDDRRKRRSLSSSDRIGKYQLDKIIHQGKYRTIYKAHDPFLERDVAIKVSQFPIIKKVKKIHSNYAILFFWKPVQ